MGIQREEWLNLANEAAIEPDLPICDPHHHLWDYPDLFSESLIPPFARPFRHYLLSDLLRDTAGGHKVVATVAVECNSMYRSNGALEMRPVGETEFVQGIAAQSASGLYGNTRIAAGIVGFADLTLGSKVAAVLEAHLEASRDRFRGVRFVATRDADPGVGSRVNSPDFLLQPKFKEGFTELYKYNLSFDTYLYYPQLDELVKLARSFPDTTIILEHTGGPLGVGSYAGRHDDTFRDWKNAIAAVAGCPNVMIKLGGMGQPRTGFGWHEMTQAPGSIGLAQDMTPYFMWCIEKFGTNRCMFESNFPVDRVSYSYNNLWNAFKRITGDFSTTERADLFQGTAARAYRIP